MRHVYDCPLRWGDMDLLGHVNNVRYVDYVQEARIELLARLATLRGEGGTDEGVVVVRHDLTFAAPLVFRRPTVRVDSWVSRVRAASFTLDHEVYDEAEDGSRTVWFRARTQLCPFDFATERPRRLTDAERELLSGFSDDGTPDPAGARLPERPSPLPTRPDSDRVVPWPLRTRWSDVDAYGHVNNSMYVEYFQEARIALLGATRWSSAAPDPHAFDGAIVVAQTAVEYRRPVLFRHEAYVVDSWISRVGGTSFEISSILRDPLGEGPSYAAGQVTLVSFDLETQRSAPLAESSRAWLRERLVEA